jgi:hypothetical protein
MSDPALSRSLRLSLALLLVSLAWGLADELAQETRSRPSTHAVAARAHLPRLAAGRVAPDLSDAPALPAGDVEPPAAVERRVEGAVPLRESRGGVPEHLREYPRGPPRRA